MRAEPGAVRPPAPGPAGRAAAAAYARAIARRNRRFDAGRGVHRLHVPVISIGNLSVGGTGKTPMVERVCSWLLEAGHRPAIAMRGYKANGGLSDEAEGYRERLGEVPVVAQPDRLAGLRELFARESGRDIDVVVLDDGFQHRRIARDLDVVLLDLSRDPLGDRLLPAGWLREPIDALARADAVVLTHAELAGGDEVTDLRAQVGAVAPGAPLALATHEWTALDVLEDGAERVEPVEWLRGRFAVAVCAIGNPRAFLRGVERAAGEVEPRGGRTMAAAVLRDHDPYKASTVNKLLAFARGQEADAIVTTGKDWAKLRGVLPERWPCPVARPRLEMAFAEGEGELRDLVLAAAGAGGAGRE